MAARLISSTFKNYCFCTAKMLSAFRATNLCLTSSADSHLLLMADLTENGFLGDTERTWKLTNAGKAAAKVNSTIQTEMCLFAKQYEHLRGDALIAAAYRQHPYYAIQSAIIRRILKRDALALEAVEAARPGPGMAGICTIGYEGRSLEGYLNLLLKDGVTVLCDVCSHPLIPKVIASDRRAPSRAFRWR